MMKSNRSPLTQLPSTLGAVATGHAGKNTTLCGAATTVGPLEQGCLSKITRGWAYYAQSKIELVAPATLLINYPLGRDHEAGMSQRSVAEGWRLFFLRASLTRACRAFRVTNSCDYDPVQLSRALLLTACTQWRLLGLFWPGTVSSAKPVLESSRFRLAGPMRARAQHPRPRN